MADLADARSGMIAGTVGPNQRSADHHRIRVGSARGLALFPLFLPVRSYDDPADSLIELIHQSAAFVHSRARPVWNAYHPVARSATLC